MLNALEYDPDFKSTEAERTNISSDLRNPDNQELWDYQLTPMIRGKFISGLQELVVNGGMKKWEKVLDEISQIFNEGKFL